MATAPDCLLQKPSWSPIDAGSDVKTVIGVWDHRDGVDRRAVLILLKPWLQLWEIETESQGGWKGFESAVVRWYFPGTR